MSRLEYIHIYLLNIAYFILVIYFFLYSTTITGSVLQSKFILLIGLGLVAISIILRINKNIKQKLILYTITTIIILTELYYILFKHQQISDFDNLLLYSLLFMIAVNSQNVIRLIKISFFTKLGLTILTILLFEFGIIHEVTLSRGESVRHSLGFFHPNTLGFIIMCLTLEFLFLYLKKINWIHISLITVINIFIYYITQSRTSFICVMLILFAAFVIKYTDFLEKKSVKNTLLVLIPIIFLFSIVMPWIYRANNRIYVSLDQLLSSRLQSGHYYLGKFGINLFGQPFPETLHISSLNINVLLDSAYLRILIQSGLLIFIVLSLGILYRCYVLVKNGFMIEVSIIVIAIVYSFFERATNNVFLYSSLLVIFREGSIDRPSLINYWKKIRYSLSIKNK